MPAKSKEKSTANFEGAYKRPRSPGCMDATCIVRIMGDLPTMPAIAAQLMEVLANSRSTPRHIHDLITKDLGLSAQVLKVANSPYYGASRSVSTIKDAVLSMGYDAIRSLVMTAVLKGMFSCLSLSEQLLWEHAICCAFTSRRIAVEVGFPRPEEAYLAGLMHDMGKAALFLRVPAVMREIMQQIGDDAGFVDLEQQKLGFTHAEVGQIMADNWLFSKDIEEAIAYHHCPDRATSARELAHIVLMADSICHKLQIGPTRKPDIDLLELESTKVMALSPAAIARILESTVSMIKEEAIGL